jgi:hypothetical protein
LFGSAEYIENKKLQIRIKLKTSQIELRRKKAAFRPGNKKQGCWSRKKGSQRSKAYLNRKVRMYYCGFQNTTQKNMIHKVFEQRTTQTFLSQYPKEMSEAKKNEWPGKRVLTSAAGKAVCRCILGVEISSRALQARQSTPKAKITWFAEWNTIIT